MFDPLSAASVPAPHARVVSHQVCPRSPGLLSGWLQTDKSPTWGKEGRKEGSPHRRNKHLHTFQGEKWNFYTQTSWNNQMTRMIVLVRWWVVCRQKPWQLFIYNCWSVFWSTISIRPCDPAMSECYKMVLFFSEDTSIRWRGSGLYCIVISKLWS